MKCEICGKRNKNKGWDSRHCSTCGLYIEEVDKAKVISVIDGMINRWNYVKKINYYETSEFEGETIYKIKYKGVKKIINELSFGDETTLYEVECLIQLISYLSLEFEYNITSLAITLFWFINDNLIKCDKFLTYWIKRGKKEKVRKAFETEYCILYANEKNNRIEKPFKIKKLNSILRHLPTDSLR